MPSAMRIQLASLGAITCLMRGTIGEIVAGPVGPSCRSMCSTSPRRLLLPAATSRWKKCFQNGAAITAPGSSLTFSMYRDLRKGAPVEADHILGDFIERGSAHGVATPLLKAAFVNLHVYQDRLPKC